MDDIRELQKAVRALRTLLTKHAETNGDAEMVLGLMTETMNAIERGEVVPPTHDKFKWYFASTEGPLFHLEELGEAHARYSRALEGCRS